MAALPDAQLAPSSQARQASSRRPRTRGKFENKTWYCDCKPPLPAVFLQVKKDGKNKGRWFHTCQKPWEEQCEFFLFEEEALARQRNETQLGSQGGRGNQGIQGIPAGQQMNNSPREPLPTMPHSEVASTFGASPVFSPAGSVFGTPDPRRGVFGGMPHAPDMRAWRRGVVGGYDPEAEVSDSMLDDEHASGLACDRAPVTPAPKRKRPAEPRANNGSRLAEDFSDLDSDDARELVQLSERSERLYDSQRSQPSQQGNGPSTPSRLAGRMGGGAMQTPATGNSQARNNQVGAFGSASKRFKTAQGTPTPARTRNAFPGVSQPQGENAKNNEDLTTEVLEILKAEPIRETTRQALRGKLSEHTNRDRANERTREWLRSQLKAKDQRIAELQAHVAKLENGRKAIRPLQTSITVDWSRDFEDE